MMGLQRFTCREYTHLLASGQLDDAGVLTRLSAQGHLLACTNCRNFTRNNARLSSILQNYREHLLSDDNPVPPGGDAPR